MEDNREPGFFELRPFERWCIEELEKVTRQFRKHFFLTSVDFLTESELNLIAK